MNAEDFRRLALALPEASEGAHMGHADFRVGGRIFASLGPDETWGMVKLPTELQATLVSDHPAVFAPSSGAWGRQGATQITLARARTATVREALVAAWRRTAPKRLVGRHDDEQR